VATDVKRTGDPRERLGDIETVCNPICRSLRTNRFVTVASGSGSDPMASLSPGSHRMSKFIRFGPRRKSRWFLETPRQCGHAKKQ
jgi:hypothetical protein